MPLTPHNRLLSHFTKSERGVSLLEFTLILPVIIFVFLLTVDIGRVFGQYLAVQGLVNSGVRTAQGAPSLEIGTDFESNVIETAGTCNISYVFNTVNGANSGHKLVHDRVVNAICSMKALNALAIEDIRTFSTYTGFAAGSPISSTVRVRISGRVRLINGVILPWDTVPISSEAIAPYLS